MAVQVSNKKGGITMRTNLDKQEEVVTALWDFAANIQLRPDAGGTKATIASGQPNAGTVVGLNHVRTAMKKILDTFGHTIVEQP
jgi:hypothetical protein